MYCNILKQKICKYLTSNLKYIKYIKIFLLIYKLFVIYTYNFLNIKKILKILQSILKKIISVLLKYKNCPKIRDIQEFCFT